MIERASLLASGADFRAALSWIEAHGGVAEAAAPPRTTRGGGMYGPRQAVVDPTPLRFVLPPGALR